MQVWDNGKAYLNNFATSLEAIESVSQRIINLLKEMNTLQSNEETVRTYLTNLGREVGYNEATGNVIVDGQEYGNTKNVFTNVDGHYQGTAEDIEKMLRELGLPSYDVGSWSVPKDQLAWVHEDELIVPPEEAPKVRTLLRKFTDLSESERNSIMGKNIGIDSNSMFPEINPASQTIENATQANLDRAAISNNSSIGDLNVAININGNADKNTVKEIRKELEGFKDDIFSRINKQYIFSPHKRSFGSMR